MSEFEAPHLEAGRREAMEVAEAARETEWHKPSFVAELFLGRVLTSLIFPYPVQPDADRRLGDDYLARVETFLKTRVDPDAMDRTREMPPEVIQGLVTLGCFGMKIPKEYGGLGFSQVNYNRTISLIASFCGSTAVWLSAHQSIGVPTPLKMFGTEEQKKKYLPRLATGAISAFALTEPDVGSDPAKMRTTATPTADGEHYIIEGEKLWCTNGPVADIIVVMARTPSRTIGGKERKQITAFIVEKTMPGVEVVHRCDFMGIKAIQNGLLRFKGVKVPKANIIWGPGRGLKLALMTLNTGRMTLPAACVGAAKQCLAIARQWSNERSQWGAPIGKHEAIALKIARMAADVFAMESVTWLASALVDRGDVDIRLEAAMAKVFCSESCWRIVDDTMQIRGGRGYETADSLRARGEPGIAVERMMRDARINLIIEGTSEIMRLFIAREALDAHMKVAGDLFKPKLAMGLKVKAALKTAAWYALWYPRQWLPAGVWPQYARLGPLATHARFVERASRRLARTIFHNMLRYQLRLERRQQTLARFVDIGIELFAMMASCSRAQMLLAAHPDDASPRELADLFCRQSRRRVAALFSSLARNEDRRGYRLAQRVLAGRFAWLEEGIIS